MNRILFFLLFLTGYQSFAQSSDVLLLNKRKKTIKRYYAGTNIELTTTTGIHINAQVSKIKNDTLFLNQYVVRQTPTQLGVYILDTVTTYHYAYHYNQIQAIGKNSNKFNWSASGGALFGGGLLLVIANGVVFLVDQEKFSPALMIASAALATIGYVMVKSGGKGMVIGKKYSLVYMAISDNK